MTRFARWRAIQRLSPHERSGFPDSYREGAEEAILGDIEAKLPALGQQGAIVVDIGCGANPLAFAIRDLCARRGTISC